MKNIFIVTGTSKGLGLSFVKELISKGNFVFSISRSETPELKRLKTSKLLVHYDCDLTNQKKLINTLDEIFDKILVSKFNSITLINNAGTINPIGNVGINSFDLLSKSIDVNLKAPILISEFFIKETQALNCSKYILNISSGAGRKPYAGWATYCASKAGLDLFTTCIGVEQLEEKHPVKVVSFAPGVVDTNMQVTIRNTPKEVFDSVTRFIDLKSNNELLSPQFVAKNLLELLKSNKLVSGGCYDIRDYISTP